jgi:hypothetical protein
MGPKFEKKKFLFIEIVDERPDEFHITIYTLLLKFAFCAHPFWTNLL